MTRCDIIKYLNLFPYNKHDYWLITGAAMVLYGIRDETSDIDMGCTTSMADQLAAAGYAYRITESGNRWFKYNEQIEIFENWINDAVTEINGLPVITIQGLIEMKQELGREKDLNDIGLIQDFLMQPDTNF